MPRELTVKDAYLVMNSLVSELTGADPDVTVVDAASFTSAGELVMSYGTENVFNALTLILNRTMVASRPYRARLDRMEQVDTGLYSSRIRKISFFASDALPSGNFNTDLFTNLQDGYTNGQNTQADPNSTKSQWEQNQKVPLELNFAGSTTWQYCVTRYEDQLQAAFRGPEEFNAFISGYLTESANDVESQREAWNRMNLLAKIGQTYDMGIAGQVRNLTVEFNDKFGTSFTSAELRSTYLKEFLAFFVAEVKKDVARLEHRSALYHWTPSKQDAQGNTLQLLRHTPRERQQLYLYNPLFIDAEALVMPEIFNTEYLRLDDSYQGVDFWQNERDPAHVNVIPPVIDSNGQQMPGDAVNLDYVIGLLTDEDGLMTNFQAEIVRSTPVEARKGYRNIWTTFLRNNMVDPTENAVLYYMADED